MSHAGHAPRRDHGGDSALSHQDRLDRLGVERGPKAAGVRQAGAGEPLRVERAVFRCEQSPVALRGGAGPAFPHLVRLQPVAPQPRLALPGHVFLEPNGVGLVECDGGDAGPPEADVDAGRFPQRRGEGFVQVARPHRQGHQRIVSGLDLGGEHARRGGRRRGRVGAGLENGDREAPQGGRPGAGGPNGAAPDDGHIRGAHVLAPV